MNKQQKLSRDFMSFVVNCRPLVMVRGITEPSVHTDLPQNQRSTRQTGGGHVSQNQNHESYILENKKF